MLQRLKKDWLMNPIDNLSGLHVMTIWKTLLSIQQNTTSISLRTIKSRISSLKVVPTPGHSIGGISLIFDEEEIVFSGDASLKETIGRWDLPTGNHDQLLTSIREQLFTLPNHYKVFPGHGWDTTIGHEKNFNPHFS